MRATVSQVRGWEPAVAAAVSDGLVAANLAFDTAMRRAGRCVDAALEDWRGDAAAAAALRALDSQLAGNHVSAVVLDIADAFADAGNLDEVRSAVVAVEREARAHGCVVADDGRITAPEADTGYRALDLALQACFDAKAVELQARMIPLLDTAGEIDRTVAAQLAEAAAALAALDLNPHGAALDPRVRAVLDGTAFLPDDPFVMHELWESLAPADRDALFAYDPTLGARDGIPAVSKDFYNRRHLDHLRVTARAEYAALQAAHPDWADGSGLPDTPEQWRQARAWESARAEIATRLAGYDAVADRLAGGGPTRFLYGIDDQGRGAVALGNPDSARDIATFVPGVAASLTTLGQGVDRSRALLDAADRAEESARTSVIAWYGYHAPPDLPAAVSSDRATDAAPALDRFQDGLRASHTGPPSHNTLVGHSYGSTVIGVALSDGGSVAADDVIFVGSPGVEADHVGELRLEGVPVAENRDHVFATADPADPIPIVGGLAHGVSPTERVFGATVFESASGLGVPLPPPFSMLSNPRAHSAYWDLDNPGLATQGEIIAGQYPR
ncbi:alpha/beta hydrolase [Nocardia sp. NPDC050406]|uniref:alpha/beta hydrolase n=1 Tax=Nocardia sp. NPDC050406 TaxID=3364318 RepID=UPI00378C7EFF